MKSFHTADLNKLYGQELFLLQLYKWYLRLLKLDLPWEHISFTAVYPW